MSRGFAGLIVILLVGCLVLSGCATGNLPRDSAFFPYKTTDNLHVIVSKTFANITLGFFYVTFYAAAIALQVGSGYNRQCW